MLTEGSHDGGFFMRFLNDNMIRQRVLRAELSLRVVGKHDTDLDTKDTLSHLDVADGFLDVLSAGLTRVNHDSITKLHSLGTLSTELSGDDNFTSAGTRLHDETEDTIAGTANSKTTNQLVAERLALGDGTETTVSDLLGVKLNGSYASTKTLLDNSGKLADTTTAFSQDILGAGSKDDAFGTGRSASDLNTRISVFSEFLHQEVVQFSLEDTILDSLVLLAYLLSHYNPKDRKFIYEKEQACGETRNRLRKVNVCQEKRSKCDPTADNWDRYDN